MSRAATAVLAVAAAAAACAVVVAGCNEPSCGPGTTLVQIKGGALECQPATGLPTAIPCNADAGAVIVAGQCVSRVQCGPGTSLDARSGLCVPSGLADPCPPPAAGHVCVSGTLHHFVDDSPLAPGETVHVGISDPLAFLGGSPPLFELDSTGSYVFPDVPVPASGLVAIGAGDSAGTPNVVAATGAFVSAGKSYRVDGYVLPRAVVDGWQAQTGNDYFSGGAYVARFYAERQSDATDYTLFEKTPVAGVALLEDAAAPAGVRYFGASLATVDGSATVTGASGAALVAAPSGIHNFSGMGGSVAGAVASWPTVPGGSTAGVVFITRLHPL
ncbi:MAG: hypothetical protein ACXVCV_00235 [Polyangia bacterium]